MTTETRVKICGITNLADAEAAVEQGADALGFAFAESPRQVDRDCARGIIRDLPPFVTFVGLFVNAPPSVVMEHVESCGLTAVQLHGDEAPEYLDELRGPKLIKAFRIRSESDLQALPKYAADAYLLDAFVKGKRGGTGRTLDWPLVQGAGQYGRIILAGGLNPSNVAEAIAVVQPYAVDVSSGVEAAPGQKDHTLLADFIRSAKGQASLPF